MTLVIVGRIVPLSRDTAVAPLESASFAGKVWIADDGRIAWTTRVTPHSPPGVAPDLERAAEAMPTRLYRIVAEVTFAAPSGGQRTFALATMRIGAREPR